MKKIVLILAFVLPVLAFGQVVHDVEARKYTGVFIETIEFSEISNPYEIKEEEFNLIIKDQIPITPNHSLCNGRWYSKRLHMFFKFMEKEQKIKLSRSN